MDKNYKGELQKQVIEFYKKRCNKSLAIVSEYCCSEMARYIGWKVLSDFNNSKAYILKGDISKSLAHDILIIEYNKGWYIIDPTIWQLQKNKRSIFIGEYNSLNDLISAVRVIYKGEWKSKPKKLDKKTLKKEIPELVDNLDKIIEENCR